MFLWLSSWARSTVQQWFILLLWFLIAKFSRDLILEWMGTQYFDTWRWYLEFQVRKLERWQIHSGSALSLTIVLHFMAYSLIKFWNKITGKHSLIPLKIKLCSWKKNIQKSIMLHYSKLFSRIFTSKIILKLCTIRLEMLREELFKE